MVVLKQDGCVGYGEGAGTHGYSDYSPESMRAALESVRKEIEATRLETPDGFWEQIAPALAKNRFALCALDEAVHDLWGKLQGKPVWQLWGLIL